MRVAMALPKAVGYMVVLLVIYYSLENQGYRVSLNVFAEGHTYVRQKREASLSSSSYVLQAAINISDLESLRTLLSELSLPLMINSTSLLTSINTTTLCSSNMSGYQCRCEESYAWSYNSCINLGPCDAIIGDTCGCVNALPADDQYCQLNTSQTEPTTSPTASTTPRNDTVNIDIVLDMRIPGSSVPSNFIHLFRDTVRNVLLPYTITQSLQVIGLNFTTGCLPNSTGGLQCECEEQFAWSCDKCVIYGACRNATSQTCGCINGLPSDGDFCQPLTNVSQCPAPTPGMTTPMTTPTTSTNTTSTNTTPTTSTNTTPPPTTNTTNTTTPASTNTRTNTTTNTTTPTTSTNTTPTTTNTTTLTTSTNTTTPTTINTTTNTTTPATSTNTTTPTTTNTTLTSTNTTTPTTTNTTTPTTTNTTTSINTTILMRTPPTTNTTTTPTTSTNTTTPTTALTTNTTTTTDTTPMTTPMTTTMPITTMPTMTTIPPVKTTAPNSTTVITQARSLSFTMDMIFDPSYNNPNNTVYQDTFNAIERQSNTHISTLKAVELIKFWSGSTICNYAIIATSFQETEIKAVKAGIFTDLSEKYPMIYDSPEPLEFDPPQVLFGSKLTVNCGPPPANLNFGTNWIAEWRRGNNLIRQDDQHEFSNGGATLTVLKFFSTDNGGYECKLKRENKSVFRQRSIGEFKLKEGPLIQVSPVRNIVQCENGKEVLLKCSVNSPYEVEFKGTSTAGTGEITHQYPIDCAKTEEIITCQVKNFRDFSKDITLVLSTQNSFRCEDPVFGVGNEGDEAVAPCEANKVGEKTVVCEGDGKWREKRDDCVLEVVQQLLDQAEFLNNNSLPNFLSQLSNVTLNSSEEVVESPATINAIVDILSALANLSIPITRTSMKDILLTTGVLTTDEAKASWNFLNTNNTRNILVTRATAESVSSTFLLSLETITSSLTEDSFNIDTPLILLNKTTFTDTFNAEFNSSVETTIPESDGRNKSITVITFASMDNVLPARDQDNSSSNVINGRVVLVQSNGTINNVSFTFDVINDTLGNPQCVFWNFSLLDGLGGWDDEGCKLVRDTNKTVTCNCNHLTSFSILMSPYSPDDPVLDYITYIGVGISMGSLVLCLIIEAAIWRKIRKNNTSYLRHVSIVNIAVSLLIANIWFIIGAAISDPNPPACTATTFFSHFFYLALFFWMLASALLLLYRTVSVFDGGLSKKSLLAIGFCLGYGAPLIIVIITIAVTAPKEAYIRQTGCWLNWDESKALLAFVIPALLIVVINFLILGVVMYKMLRRRAVGNAAQAAERHVLLVIIRSLAVLTPFFGLTWGLGVGVMTDPRNRGIHISFAFFNSLQGFFILVFGTLLDKKVRSEIAIKSQSSTNRTGTFSTGISSSSGLGFLRNWRRDGYNASSSASDSSQSFANS